MNKDHMIAQLEDAPFCTRIWAALVLGFFFAAAFSSFFILHICDNEDGKSLVLKRTYLNHGGQNVKACVAWVKGCSWGNYKASRKGNSVGHGRVWLCHSSVLAISDTVTQECKKAHVNRVDMNSVVIRLQVDRLRRASLKRTILCYLTCSKTILLSQKTNSRKTRGHNSTIRLVLYLTKYRKTKIRCWWVMSLGYWEPRAFQETFGRICP